MDRVYRAAAEHGLIILFHAGEDPNYETVRGVPTTFKRVLAQHPDLTVILAHLGGYRVWDEVAEHLLGERVYLDTAYTLGHLPAEDAAEIMRGHGVDRILFGSDGPWTDAGASSRSSLRSASRATSSKQCYGATRPNSWGSRCRSAVRCTVPPGCPPGPSSPLRSPRARVPCPLARTGLGNRRVRAAESWPSRLKALAC